MKPNTQQSDSVQAQSRPDMRKGTGVPAINYRLRFRNRMLPTPKLLGELSKSLPELYQAALVVGRWVWVQFDDVPAAEIRQQLGNC